MFDNFSARHIGVSNEKELSEMLRTIGVKTVDELIGQDYKKDAFQLEKLMAYVDEEEVLGRLEKIKKAQHELQLLPGRCTFSAGLAGESPVAGKNGTIFGSPVRWMRDEPGTGQALRRMHGF